MKIMVACFSFFMVLPSFAQTGQGAAHQGIDPDTAYKNNCTRCHTTIQKYSPQMTKTIIMHMRVKANLPEDTAQAILEFLNGEAESSPRVAKDHKPASNDGRHK